MYRVTVITNGVEYVLHDARSPDEQIYEDELSEEVGRTPTFRFYLPPNHPNIDKILPLVSEIFVKRDNQVEFFGRAITPSSDIYNTCCVECVGGMSYLADSMQQPFSLTGTVADFLLWILDIHNSMVEPQKQIKIGRVNVAGREATRTIESYTDTLTVIFQQLVETYGGYLRVRCESDGRYLDYLNDYGGYNTQIVKFGENILDISRQINASDVITVLIPEGGEINITNEDGTTGSKRIGIAEVNGGVKYIEDEDAIARWGRIWGHVSMEDITDPEQLLTEAKRYLDSKVTFPETIELTALDLSYVNVDIDALKVGYWTQFISKPHEISGTYLLKKLIRHLTAPEKDKVSFGGTRNTISGSVADNAHSVNIKIEKVKQSTSKEIQQKIENATNLITGGLGGYLVIGLAEDGHPEETLWMDAPDKAEARNIIRINKNGIGFSTSGYNGEYRNAWTIDGNLVADFITVGSMLADRIRGGTLEVGGKELGKDGTIIIKDAEGNIIGQLSKDGIRITNGYFSGQIEVGGNLSGKITVKNEVGTEIGYWDKTGLHVYDGTIEGVTIKGSSIEGGTINVNNGTFEVNQDGEVTIESGIINLGPIQINNGLANIGGFRVTGADFGAIFSTDVGRTIRIYSKASNTFDNGPAIELEDSGYKTRIGRGSVYTHDIALKDLEEAYDKSWGSISYNIIELWNRLIALENSIN